MCSVDKWDTGDTGLQRILHSGAALLWIGVACFEPLVVRGQQSIASLLVANAHPHTPHAMLREQAADATEAVPVNMEEALQAMFAKADRVFTGEVVMIQHEGGAIVVQWRVESVILGVTPGTLYPVREWDGLWADGQARYVIGQRALLMLHAPAVSGGYSSPVGGADGIIPLRGDTAGSVLDLRWLALHVAAASTVLPASSLQAAVPASESTRGSRDTLFARGLNANSSVDGATVLSMLCAWQLAESKAR